MSDRPLCMDKVYSQKLMSNRRLYLDVTIPCWHFLVNSQLYLFLTSTSFTGILHLTSLNFYLSIQLYICDLLTSIGRSLERGEREREADIG